MRKTGDPHPLLAKVELPVGTEYIWSWFGDIASRNSGNGFGPALTTWSEYHAWAQMTGSAPTPFEMRCLLMLDDIRFEFQARWSANKPKAPKKPKAH